MGELVSDAKALYLFCQALENIGDKAVGKPSSPFKWFSFLEERTSLLDTIGLKVWDNPDSVQYPTTYELNARDLFWTLYEDTRYRTLDIEGLVIGARHSYGLEPQPFLRVKDISGPAKTKVLPHLVHLRHFVSGSIIASHAVNRFSGCRIDHVAAVQPETWDQVAGDLLKEQFRYPAHVDWGKVSGSPLVGTRMDR